MLQKQPAAVFAAIRQEKIARSVLEVDRADVPLVAFGDVAEELAAVAAGSAVRLLGELIVAGWMTGDKTPHVRLEVRIESLEMLNDRRRRCVA